MKFNQWTLGLAAVGVVSMASVVQAEEAASSVMTALSSTTLSGYVDTSAQWNFGTGNANNPATGFNTAGKADGFNLNVVKLTLEKPADAADGWGAGYKVDALFGPDANVFATTSSGFAFSDFGIKQAYVDLKAPVGNGLDIKMGVWDTIIGYEVFESGNNPNFTRSYGYTIEPTTHTGVLAAYQVSELVAVQAGVANTFGPVINGKAAPVKAESFKTYMGSVSLTAPKDWGFVSGSTLYGGVINGFGGTAAAQTSWYAGTSLNTPLEALKVGAAYDYRGTPAKGALGPTYGNAVALYTTYQLTEKLTLNGRAEYFSQGTGAGGVLGGIPTEVESFTATAQYDLWKNVVSRLEFRWDHQSDGGADAFGGTVPGTGTRRNAYQLIANIIYKF